MSNVGDILESVVKYGDSTQLSKYLKSCDETSIFSDDNEQTSGAIALTNRLLNENSTRRHGLLVLKCLVSQLPYELIQANLLSWIQLSVKGLAQKESYSTVVAAADALCILLSLSTKFADCRKEISLNTIGKVFEILYDLKNSDEFQITVLSTLSAVLQHYGKSGVSWKDKFEKYLITLIENDGQSVSLASRCYLRLAASGPPGTDFVNYKENWVVQYKSLSTALHLVLDQLFDNVNEIEQFSRGRIKWKPNFQLPPVKGRVPYLKMSGLTQQFSCLCRFLEVMLLGQYPVSKRVVPELLLSVACRGLAVTPLTLQAHETSDTPSLSAVLPQLQSSCLGILVALIKSCRTNLIMYGPMICKLLSQVLKSTETPKNTYGLSKPYRTVRILAYECLSCWLTVANCSSNIEKHPEIVDYIISDIQFKKPTVALNLASKMLKGKMGKKRRQALVNQTVNNKEQHVPDKEANKDVCCAALNVVPALLESASSLLPPQAHKDLQSAVTSELLLTQLNPVEHVPPPYSNKSCRLGLYKSFMATCLNYHPSFPPPLSYGSQMISNGLQDSCPEIVQFCILSSSSLEKMLRPIGPTLNFPIELPDMFSALIKFRSVDRRNRPKNDHEPTTESSEPAVTVAETTESAAEPELNPLLVDPEMSEFDFQNSGKAATSGDEMSDCELAAEEPQRDRISDYGSAGDNHVLDAGSNTQNGDTTKQNGSKEYSPDVEFMSKRKLEHPDESPTLKKIKSIVTIEKPSDGANEADIEPSTPSPTSSVAITIQGRTDSISAPENDVEEDMLNSFVDVID